MVSSQVIKAFIETSMRLMSMISLITAICFGLITIVFAFIKTEGGVPSASQAGDGVYLTVAFLTGCICT